MDLKEYFEAHTGTGVLATADAEGRVDAAVYARPHVMDDGSVAFIMLDRLSHQNLAGNPHAAYLFIQQGGGYQGVRLYLTKTGESDDQELIKPMLRRCPSHEGEHAQGQKFLVYFRIDKALNLVGGEPAAVCI
jgi:hypothetical protein